MSVWYGSLQNRIAERVKNPKPEVGMGATALYWSDRHAYEVIAVKDDKHITVRRMKATCKDYYAGDWEVEPDPNGYTLNLYFSKKGWRERIGKNGLGDIRFAVGYADEYEDPSF